MMVKVFKLGLQEESMKVNTKKICSMDGDY